MASKTTPKLILIVSGSAGMGKDTFVAQIAKHKPTAHVHIADKAKHAAFYIGWNGRKDEKGRKLLSDLKIAIDEFNDGCFSYVCEITEKFLANEGSYAGIECLCIYMRESKDIKRFSNMYECYSVCVFDDRKEHITSNIADAEVFNHPFDFVIKNCDTIENLESRAIVLLSMITHTNGQKRGECIEII